MQHINGWEMRRRVVVLAEASEVPLRILAPMDSANTSTMGIRFTTTGITEAGSGLYGLFDELFTYLPIKGGAGGLSPLPEAQWHSITTFRFFRM